jgi:DNA-binding NtrC family response regulator
MSESPFILIVDDDPDAVTSLARALKLQLPAYRFEGVGNAEKALESCRVGRPMVVVADLVLDPKRGVESGLSLVADLQIQDPTCRVIVLTGHGGVDVGVRALERGAASFLEKPAEISHLVALLRDGVQQSHLRRAYEQRRGEGGDDLSQILVGSSEVMQAVRRQIQEAARTPQPVLIYGETGTGKGLAANALHRISLRAARKFVRYQPNFASADLTNSDLFGHLKGSFTGAHEDRRGLLAEADGGTFFLDEVDEVPLETQVSLLGVLQERRYRPLGSNREQAVSVKFICATNRPPEDSLREGKLRKDFYHRLAHVTIILPPLRLRLTDLSELVAHVLQQLRSRDQLHVFDIADDAVETLKKHSWPGNVRELEAIVEQAAYRAQFSGKTTITSAEVLIPRSHLGGPTVPEDFNSQVEAFKLSVIEQALARHKGNQVHAARELGLDRSSMRRILARKDL